MVLLEAHLIGLQVGHGTMREGCMRDVTLVCRVAYRNMEQEFFWIQPESVLFVIVDLSLSAVQYQLWCPFSEELLLL